MEIIEMNRHIVNRFGGRSKQASWSRRLLIAPVSLMACELSFATTQAMAANEPPLVLERTIEIPGVPLGPYADHPSIDLIGGRLFATPQAAKAVAVLDLQDGRLLKLIPGIGNPHGSFYSQSLKRLFVADGAAGDVKVFSGEDYSLIKTIPLASGADGMVYDPKSGLLYVNNGGEDAGMDHSNISVIDIVRMEKVADIVVSTPGLEAAVIDAENQLLYVNLVDEAAVAVVDLRKRQVVATWKLPASALRNLAIAVDTTHSRLYVACRNTAMHGALVVLDSSNGRAVATLPIGGYPDGIFIDQKRQRIYVSTGVGHVETYTIEPNDVYRHEAIVDSVLMAKTSLYSGDLDRLFVAAPHLTTEAEIMIFKPVP